MSSQVTYLSPFIHDIDEQKLVLGAVVAIGLLLIGSGAASRLRRRDGIENSIIPQPRFSVFALFDFFIEKFLAFQDSILGRDNRRHLPFTASLFLFIFCANLIGLIPGLPAITNSVGVNVGLAFVTFIYFNYQGTKAHGVLGYLKHFAGPVWWLAFIIFPVEILSTCLRILTLNLRLYWNISADHTVLHIMTGLVGPGAIPFYLMGTFVSLVQAFVFTTLTMIYILLATQHGEEEH